MTLRSRLLAFFPTAQIAVVLLSAVAVWYFANPWLIGLVAFNVYVLPIVCFRLHDLVAPLRFGTFDISRGYSPWWASYQFQSLFIALPNLEAALRLVPGLYSFWLRLWGAKIGRGVVWTPRVEILDRSLIEIGSYVVFGHESKLISHFVRRSANGRLKLYVMPVKIGKASFIGAGCRIGPGATIEPGARLAILTDVKQNGYVKSDDNFGERAVICANRYPAWHGAS